MHTDTYLCWLTFTCPLYLKFSQIFYKFFLHLHFIPFTLVSPVLSVFYSDFRSICHSLCCFPFGFICDSFVLSNFFAKCCELMLTFLLTCAFSCCVVMNPLYLLSWWWCAMLWYDGWYKSYLFSWQYFCWECYLPFFPCFFPPVGVHLGTFQYLASFPITL